MRDAQCVILGGVLYVGGGLILPGNHAQLFSTPVHPMKWSAYSTPTGLYGLTTYHSQLVLVGGRETSTDTTTNKLWTSDAGVDWNVSLPPMPTARYGLSAVNTGTPECLIVAGGGGVGGGKVDTVEVLTDGEWWTVESLPKKCYYVKSTLHNGKVYLMGGSYQGTDVYYCDVKSLLVWCQQYHVNRRSPFPLWSQFQVPNKWSSPASFGGSLLSIGGGTNSADIVALSPLHQVWVHVGKIPVVLHSAASIVLTTGELVVIGGRIGGMYSAKVKVFKASLIGEYYRSELGVGFTGKISHIFSTSYVVGHCWAVGVRE